MASSLREAMPNYRLVYFSPHPETGERVCVGLVVQSAHRASLLWDKSLTKLRCVAPDFDAKLVDFYLSDLSRSLSTAPTRERDLTLLKFGPQVQSSEPRELSAPVSDSLLQHLLERFVLAKREPHVLSAAAFRVAKDSEVAEHIERFIREFVPRASDRHFLRHVTPRQLGLGGSVPAVALGVASREELLLVDGIDLSVQTAGQAVRRTNEIVHTFWQYRRFLNRRLQFLDVKRIGLVLNGMPTFTRRLAEAHDYAVEQFGREADVAVDQHTGHGVEDFAASVRRVLQGQPPLLPFDIGDKSKKRTLND